VLGGPLGLFGEVDLALAQPLQQVVGREIDQLDLVMMESGMVSRTITPVTCATTSLSDSMCWTLTVV
jgi:hypothetical protein